MAITKGARWPAEIADLSRRVEELENLTSALTKRLQRMESRLRRAEKNTEQE